MIYNYPVENENSTTRYAVDFNDVGTFQDKESNNSKSWNYDKMTSNDNRIF